MFHPQVKRKLIDRLVARSIVKVTSNNPKTCRDVQTFRRQLRNRSWLKTHAASTPASQHPLNRQETDKRDGEGERRLRDEQSALTWSFQAEIQYRLSSSFNRWMV